MSDTAQAWVWQHSRTRGVTRLVLLALAYEAADDGTVRMGTAALMRLTNAAKGAVLDGIARAVALGELEIREPAAGSRAALYGLPCTASYPPVSGRETGPQTSVSGRETGPQTPVAVGKPDHKRIAVGKPDHKPAVSGRETGPLQLDLTGDADRATRAQDTHAQASSKAVNYRAGRKDARAGTRANANPFPEFAMPLIDTLTASKVIVKWALAEAEWFTLHALIQRSGVDMLAAAAVRAAQRADVSHARYFLSVWRDLPPAPAPGTAPVQPAPGGATVLPLDPAQPRRSRAQRTADELAQILAREAAQQ